MGATADMPAATSRRPAAGFWRRALRHRSFVLGGTLVLLVFAAALVSLVWTPWSPYDIDMAAKLKPPSFDEGFAKITVVRVRKKE